jgi:murein DD-endopeptidase MepM/ murein hydrolase activator NlpD
MLINNWTGKNYGLTQGPGAAHPSTRKFYKTHQGYDFATPQGTQVKSPFEGEVVYAGMDNTGWGNRIGVYNPKTDRTTYLSHLSKIDVQPGQKISQGAVLGLTGGRKGSYGAGNTTGEHLDITEFGGKNVQAFSKPTFNQTDARRKVRLNTRANRPLYALKLLQKVARGEL